MGILTNNNPGTYYGEDGAHGDYRFIELAEIIKSFTATCVGDGKICENVITSDITFHAVRALQELSYDTLNSTKEWEVEVPPSLTLVMPLDYVNYVKLSWSDGNGVERLIYPASKTSNPSNIVEPVEEWGGFETATPGTDITSTEDSDTKTAFKSATAVTEADVDIPLGGEGGRFGIDPQYSQANGSFYIDHKAGKFHFGSALAGKTLILKYISDGLASADYTVDLTNSLVPKFAEEAIYKHILYGALLARKDTPAGTLAHIKKERFAETRKAKLRLSNIKPEEITQILRGGSKMIKH